MSQDSNICTMEQAAILVDAFITSDCIKMIFESIIIVSADAHVSNLIYLILMQANMQYPSDNTNTNQNQWNETEIRELILYAKDLQQQNEDLRAKMIMMNTKLELEEKKVIRLTNMIKYLTNGAGTNA